MKTMNRLDRLMAVLVTILGPLFVLIKLIRRDGKTGSSGANGHAYATDQPMRPADPEKIERFMDALDRMGHLLIENNFKYQYILLPKSFDKCMKYHRVVNCANYVSFALQDMGLMTPGKIIWMNDDVHDKGLTELMAQGAQVDYPCKVPAEADLQPGDICGFKWGSLQHTMVFYGVDENGELIWYSGGSAAVVYKDYGPKREPAFDDREVLVRVRI